jgi:hypothetical protein
MENGHLMSESQHLQFQRGPPLEPEGYDRSHCRQDRKHPGQDKAVGAKLQCFQGIRNCEQAQDPAEVLYEFQVSLENPSLRWMSWQEGVYVLWTPPGVGHTQRFSP